MKHFDESLHKEMKDRGYHYINIPGDNDCYFHAIATAINIGTVIAGESPKQSAASIRQLLVDKLKQNGKLTNLLIPQLPSYLQKEKLLDSLLPSKSYQPAKLTAINWGGDFLNYAMHYLLGVHIIKHAYIDRYSSYDYSTNLEFHTVHKKIVELGLPEGKKLQYPVHISVEKNSHYSLWLTPGQYQELLNIDKGQINSVRLLLGTQGILLPVLSDTPEPSESDKDSTEQAVWDQGIDCVKEPDKQQQIKPLTKTPSQMGELNADTINSLQEQAELQEEFQEPYINSDVTFEQLHQQFSAWGQTTNNRQADIEKMLEKHEQTIKIFSDQIEPLKIDIKSTEITLINASQKLNDALIKLKTLEKDKSKLLKEKVKLKNALKQEEVESRELQLRVRDAHLKQIEQIKKHNENQLKESRSREEEAIRKYSEERQKVSDVLSNKSEVLEKVIEKNLELTQQKGQMAEELQAKEETMQKLYDKVSQLKALLNKANSQLLRQSHDHDKTLHLQSPTVSEIGMEVVFPPGSMTESQTPVSTGTPSSSPISSDVSYQPGESEESSDEEVEEMGSASDVEIQQDTRRALESVVISRGKIPHREMEPDDVNSTSEEQIQLDSELSAIKPEIEGALTLSHGHAEHLEKKGIPFPDLIGVAEAHRQWTKETFKYVVYLINKDFRQLTPNVLLHLDDDTVEYYEACMDYSKKIMVGSIREIVSILNKKGVPVPKRGPFLEKCKDKWKTPHFRMLHWQKCQANLLPLSIFNHIFEVIDPELEDYPRLIRDYLVYNLNSQGNTEKDLSSPVRQQDIARTLQKLRRVNPPIPALVKGQAFNHKKWDENAFEDFLILYGEDYTGYSVGYYRHLSVSLSQQLHDFKKANNRDGYNDSIASICKNGNFNYGAIMNRYTHQHSPSLEFMPVDGLSLDGSKTSASLFLYYAWAFGFSEEMLKFTSSRLLLNALRAIEDKERHEQLYKQLLILLARTYKTTNAMLSSRPLKEMPVPDGDKTWNLQVIEKLMKAKLFYEAEIPDQ